MLARRRIRFQRGIREPAPGRPSGSPVCCRPGCGPPSAPAQIEGCDEPVGCGASVATCTESDIWAGYIGRSQSTCVSRWRCCRGCTAARFARTRRCRIPRCRPQPGSKTYRVMTAFAYYAGLRPSEVVMLRVRSANYRTKAGGASRSPKLTSPSMSPANRRPGRVAWRSHRCSSRLLGEWVEQNDLTSPDQLLFRTRNNIRPSGSNWARAWHRALESVAQKPMRVYDCRHAAATIWLRAGMPLGKAARRLGHSVETLVSTYVGALDDEEKVGTFVSTLCGISATGHRDGVAPSDPFIQRTRPVLNRRRVPEM